jgi:predicted amidohydrolase YtcJ
MAADLILSNAHVFTGAHPWPGGVAVEAGRIVAVGTEAELRKHSGSKTEIIDCRSGLLAPGFIDAHVHPITGGLKLLKCNFDEARDADEAIAKVAHYVYTHPSQEWIWGGGWSMEWFERGTPSAAALDAIVPNRPVFLYNRDGHGAWVNSAAMTRAGIDRSTTDPPDGRIERLPDGAPQGTLHEGAMGLVERILPPTRPREWEAALKTGQRYLLSFGITSWQDADVRPEHDQAYLSLAGRGDLIASVVGALWWDRERGIEQIEELVSRRAAMAPRYRPTTVKLMLDGVAENYTAAMLHPYRDVNGTPTSNAGIDFIDPNALPDIAVTLDRLGFQCHFHAIGDRAVRNALDAVQAARTQNGHTGGRHHIAHLQFVNPLDIPRFKALGVTANIQPYWACAEPQVVELTLPFVSPEQAKHMYPFGSLLRTGTDLAMGSDWSVSTPDVMQQIEVAVTRCSPDHREADPFISSEALTLEQAISAATLGSARVNRVEDRVGSLEVGKDADLVVFDRDPFSEPPIGDAKVRFTIVGGRVVYERSGG